MIKNTSEAIIWIAVFVIGIVVLAYMAELVGRWLTCILFGGG